MDLDTVTEVAGTPPRYRRWLSALVGIAAVAAALLAALESDSGRREEEAFVRSSRASVQIFAEIAGSAPRTQFLANGLRLSLGNEIEATARLLEATTASPEARRVAVPMSRAESAAAARLGRAVEAMGRVAPGGPLDPATRRLLTAELSGIQRVLEYQNAQVDRADRYGTRQERAMFAIALVAIAAVLLGLAGLFGAGRSSLIAMVAAGAALAVAVGWGGSALLV
jgi:uncharacterized membrane protein YuzA (DUF378 family)